MQGREAPDLDAHATFSTVCCQMPECGKFHFLPALTRVFMPTMQHRTAAGKKSSCSSEAPGQTVTGIMTLGSKEPSEYTLK